ncbi:MAG TPA: YaaR family protein [Symbiobacteriaceae bacterium]|nr:YaaR family protein [Symbiobacteriaceae bacterium]
MALDRVRPAADPAAALANRPRTERHLGAHRPEFRLHLAEAAVEQLSDRVEGRLKEIEDLGDRLGESLTLGDLRRYRDAITELMRDLTTNMVQVRSQMEWDSQAWEHRTLVTIRTVNEELEKLAGLVVAQEKDRLAILDKIGAINGLLLDIRV